MLYFDKMALTGISAIVCIIGFSVALMGITKSVIHKSTESFTCSPVKPITMTTSTGIHAITLVPMIEVKYTDIFHIAEDASDLDLVAVRLALYLAWTING